MRAVLIKPVSDGTVLRLEDIAEPTLGPDQIRIGVRAASLNRADLAQRAQTHGIGSGSENAPVIAGLDAAGDVLEAGAHVDGIQPGDRVMTLADGGLAEQVVVDAGLAMPIPREWSYVEGAAAILALLTEHNALRTVARLCPGEVVLIHAAASGVGLAGLRLAAHFGAGRIIATTRSDRAHPLLEAHGADDIVHPDDGSFAADVNAAAGEHGVDVIIDHVGGPYLADNLRVAAIKARIVGVGRLGGAFGNLDMETLAFKRVQLTGVTFRTRTLPEKTAVVRALRTDLDLDQNAAKLRPHIHTVAPWGRIEELHTAMAANRHSGKIVIELPAGSS